MAKIRFEENDDLIDIRYDNVFKAVFTRDTPASRGALSRLVSALIGRDVEVVTITANEPPKYKARLYPCCIFTFYASLKTVPVYDIFTL